MSKKSVQEQIQKKEVELKELNAELSALKRLKQKSLESLDEGINHLEKNKKFWAKVAAKKGYSIQQDTGYLEACKRINELKEEKARLEGIKEE